MPKRYSYPNWKNLRIETRFNGIQRYLGFYPYYVGDIPKFNIKVTRLNNDAPHLTEVGVWVNLPQYGQPRLIPGFERSRDDVVMEKDCEFEVITRQGNVEYTFGFTSSYSGDLPIVTGEAEHTDRRNVNIFLFIVIPLVTTVLVLLVQYLGGK